MLDELFRGARRQKKINALFNQTGLNTHFAVDGNGDVRAAGNERAAMSYMQPDYVLVERIV